MCIFWFFRHTHSGHDAVLRKAYASKGAIGTIKKEGETNSIKRKDKKYDGDIKFTDLTYLRLIIKFKFNDSSCSDLPFCELMGAIQNPSITMRRFAWPIFHRVERKLVDRSWAYYSMAVFQSQPLYLEFNMCGIFGYCSFLKEKVSLLSRFSKMSL